MSLQKLFYLGSFESLEHTLINSVCWRWEKWLSGHICTQAVPPLWYQLRASEISASFNEDNKQRSGKCWGRNHSLPSFLVKIMLEMHRAKDITLSMRDTAVRICNFMKSPSGFAFNSAFVEQDVLPWLVEGQDRCFWISSFYIFLTRMTKIGCGVSAHTVVKQKEPWKYGEKKKSISLFF